MQCPKCGNNNLQMVSETSGDVKGFGFGKGCFGYLLVGPIGWLCGLCGMGKGKYKTTNYWVCNQCGKKFRA